MAKILPNGRIQVEAGDTLYGIYGAKWKELSGYTGDPTKLPIGTILPPKPSASLGGTLAGTLETGGGVIPTETKELPTFQADKLSTFQSLLKKISERYARSSAAVALPSAMETLGVSPEQISGRSLAGIIDFVRGQVAPSFSDVYKSTIDLLESSRAAAEKQINTLISTGGILELTDEYGARLWNMAGRDYEEYQAIKNSLQKEAEMPVRWITEETAEGRKVSIGFNRKGKEVQRTDIGAAKEKALISQATLNKLAAAGVPSDVALDIQRALNEGNTEDKIKKGLENAGRNPEFVDKFLEVMRRAEREISWLQP